MFYSPCSQTQFGNKILPKLRFDHLIFAKYETEFRQNCAPKQSLGARAKIIQP